MCTALLFSQWPIICCESVGDTTTVHRPKACYDAVNIESCVGGFVSFSVRTGFCKTSPCSSTHAHTWAVLFHLLVYDCITHVKLNTWCVAEYWWGGDMYSACEKLGKYDFSCLKLSHQGCIFLIKNTIRSIMKYWKMAVFYSAVIKAKFSVFSVTWSLKKLYSINAFLVSRRYLIIIIIFSNFCK